MLVDNFMVVQTGELHVGELLLILEMMNSRRLLENSYSSHKTSLLARPLY